MFGSICLVLLEKVSCIMPLSTRCCCLSSTRSAPMMHPTNWTPRQWTPFNDQTERAQSEQHGPCTLYPAVNSLRDVCSLVYDIFCQTSYTGSCMDLGRRCQRTGTGRSRSCISPSEVDLLPQCLLEPPSFLV